MTNFTGTNVIPTHLSLEEYWDFLQINECAAYGIRNFPTTGPVGLGCGDYWNQRERYYLSHAIGKAEERVEADRWLGFPLRRRYYSGNQYDYTNELALGKYLRGIGVETWSEVEAAQSITLSNGTINDPVEFTVAVTFSDPDELAIVRPGTTYTTIRPSSVTISGGTATVQIPRCRLLKEAYFLDYVNDNERPNYDTDANFLDEVSVYRHYLNEATGANLVWWRHKCAEGFYDSYIDVWANACAVPYCSDIRQLACAYIRQQRMGTVTFTPATYDNGYNKAAYAVNRHPDGVEVAFMRARYETYERWESSITRAIIAIAHNNLPRSYCSCDQQSLYYEDDTRPLEPPVRLGLGRSTWGLYEAEQILREFDAKKYGSYGGGKL